LDLADDDGSASAMMMAMPLLVPTVVVAAIIVPVLLDDHDIPCYRGRACDWQSQAESGDGSEGEYDLAHSSFSSGVNAHQLARRSIVPQISD
jgi:hypothetical protein